MHFVCCANTPTPIPTEGDSATDPERNRAATVQADTAIATYQLYSGHGIDGDIANRSMRDSLETPPRPR